MTSNQSFFNSNKLRATEDQWLRGVLPADVVDEIPPPPAAAEPVRWGDADHPASVCGAPDERRLLSDRAQRWI